MYRALALVIVLVGCGGKQDAGPSCDQVVDHMLAITKQQMMGHEGVNFNSQRKAMVAQCEQRNMTGEMRTCLMGAQTITDIAKCRGNKTDVLERTRRPRAPVAGSAAPATGSGSSAPAPSAGSGH